MAELWPLAAATEFRPWVLLAPDSLRVSAGFIASFFPPVLAPDSKDKGSKPPKVKV
jgi:phosphonate transport system permease protein